MKRTLHRLRRDSRLRALGALTAASAGLLAAAPGSQAVSSSSARTGGKGSQAAPPGFRRRVASWYWDKNRSTACGFEVKYGVANKKLPCGTHVTFWRAGYMVRAVVDDRGPYVAGRTWDLNERTASALHFRSIGVGYVWAKW